uniref:Uncharacterized protein n=1 Tax=Avena sativa TaxID=4498 RepID=A0ACD5ZCM6_AVESA
MASNKRRRSEPSAPAPALPDEIVTEVLLRLPVKSILRFRAVCRSWAAALSSEEFCSLHTAKVEAAEPASPRLIFISPAPGFDSTGVFSCSPSRDDDGLLFTLDDVRGDFADMTPAPCRGLTLVYDAVAPAYYVFNAATRAVTRLPRYQDSVRATAGLGFDARTKEYKVVRLFQGEYYENQKIKCEVYTLGGEHGDRWRPAAGGVPFRFCKFANAAISTARSSKLQPVFADGFLHWLIDPVHLVKVPRAAILSFSVADETFRWVRSPPFHLSGVHLAEIDDRLCIVRDLRPSGSMLEIWRMREYSSTGDWSLEHSIDLLQHVERGLIEPHVIRVVGSVGSCRSRKKVIILATSQRKVIIHDPVSGTLETIIATREINSFYETEHSAPRVSLFKESLAPVRKTNEEIALSSPMAKASKEILLRLPGDYVVQCKLVSKQWLRLIESQSFMRSYYVLKNMDRRPKIMLVGKGAGGLGFSFAPLKKFLGHAPSQGAWLDAKVVCSKPCHGMNLVSTEFEEYLCNPFTGYRHVHNGRMRTFDLPVHVLSLMGSNGCTQEGHAFAIGNRNVGLGFDLLTQEHVILQHFYHWKDFKTRQYSSTLSLVSCNIGSPEHDLMPPLPLNSMPPTYLAGVMYWMSEPRLGQSYERAIVSFDISTRMFGVVPCPPCISKWNNTSPSQTFVVEIEGVLCVVLADPLAEELDIWKLESGRWDRSYKLHLKGWSGYSLRENVVVPLAVDPKDGRFLLNTGRKLGLYDLSKRSIENLYPLDEEKHGCSSGVNQLDSKISPFVPILYEESLASYPRASKARRLRG